MNHFDYPNPISFAAERVRVSASVATAAELSAEIFTREDAPRQMLIHELRAYLLALPKERIVVNEKWPATWWDAFKERWYPAWATNRWPVEYRTIHIDKPVYAAVCPHIQTDPHRHHVEFFYHHSGANMRIER